jgi:[acyl-carrier-protein] S-malonyltransferase
MTSYALLFPGQGSQYVGMGKSFLLSRKGALLFEEAEEVLSLPLKKLMFEGPSPQLTATAIAQPAILLHSILAFRELQDRLDFTITCALGHSLGEYSALVAAEVMTLREALHVVNIRGQLMQEAVLPGLGTMAAIIGMDVENILEALAEFADEKSEHYVSCANFNGPMQTVIAGTRAGVLKASEKLKSLGARRIIPLDVSAPFHCALMESVQIKMAQVFLPIQFMDAKFPVISNVNAQPQTNGERIRQLLLKQIVSPVRFTDCLLSIRRHGWSPDAFLELGPKAALSGIVTKIDKELLVLNVDAIEDIEQLKN